MNVAERTRILRELDLERRTLLKADADLAQGEQRVRNQRELLADLGGNGNMVEADVAVARRLLQTLTETLDEWERHRMLIKQRIAYLERQTDRG